MFGRLAVTAGLVLVAGCSGGDGDDGERRAGAPAHSEAVAAPPAQRFLKLESCNGAFVPERSYLGAGWRKRSMRIGPVRLLERAALAKRRTADRETRLVRALFPPSRLVTIGVEGRARSRVGFLPIGAQHWSGSPDDLYPAVLIEDCPELPPELDDQVGGGLYAVVLSVGVLRDGCVPLAVTRNGGRVHRRVISLGGGACAE